MVLFRLELPHVSSCKELKYIRKKSKVEIYTRRVRIFFVGSEAKRNFLDCVYGFFFFFLSGKEIAITLQLIFAREAVKFLTFLARINRGSLVKILAE